MPFIRSTRLPSSRRRRIPALLATGAASVALAAAVIPQGAGALPPGGAKDKSNGATVTIDRVTVKAGGKVKVTGKNWKSKGSRVQDGAEVTIKIDDSAIIGIFPIKNKKFSGTITIPKQVPAGKHWLRFLAAEPATSIKSKTFKVTK